MKRILFVQLPPPRFSFEEPPSNIALAGGFLISALGASQTEGLEASVLEPETVDILADRGLARQILDRRPDAVGFTLYVWNVQRSLFVASTVKAVAPETVIVAGGPEVTPDNEWALRHPALDAGVFGEGESRIALLLAALLNKRPIDDIPGAFYKEGHELRINSAKSEPWDLASCPYPYLDGKITPSRDGTLFFETSRGCPFRCRYCYYHKAFSGVRFHPDSSVNAILDMAYSKDSPVRELYLMDPTFNARRGFRDLLKAMARRRATKDIAVHTELRADLLTLDGVQLLKSAGLRSAEVGLQTFNREALQEAGRSGDPEKVARGVGYLKEAGIEVTTGIILGLPKDTPESFSATLAWLKGSGAYSTVHPFVLSILPGTDFRAASAALGLKYRPRPPYYVYSTPDFPNSAFQPALQECENLFDMELDYIPPPSLVDRGLDLIDAPEGAQYVSKWIVNPTVHGQWEKDADRVAARASDPFTLWSRGSSAAESEGSMLRILRQFSLSNPHAIIRAVIEFPKPPSPAFFEKALADSADPTLFVNQSYEPLYGEGAIVSVDFTIICPDPGDSDDRERILEEYSAYADVVWDLVEPPVKGFPPDLRPVLISWPIGAHNTQMKSLFEELRRTFADHPEEVLFRDYRVQQAWNRTVRRLNPAHRLDEKVLE